MTHHFQTFQKVPLHCCLSVAPWLVGLSVGHMNSPHQQGGHCLLACSMRIWTEALCAGRISCVLVALRLGSPRSAPFCLVTLAILPLSASSCLTLSVQFFFFLSPFLFYFLPSFLHREREREPLAGSTPNSEPDTACRALFPNPEITT